jgi:hypothetical protein
MTLDPDPLQGHVDGRLIRGGTSKGFFVTPAAFPDVEGDLRDTLLLEMFGSPDPLQIDGIGGSISSTSKFMLVERSDRDGIDVDYTFGQVAVNQPAVDWSGNCGNLTSAIGTYALKEELAPVDGDPTTVTLYNTNTSTRIEQSIPIEEGVPTPYGDYAIDGVPGTGARVDSKFFDPAGGVFGSLTPTGNFRETIAVEGDEYEVSLVDATNPCVFVRADDLGLSGTELPSEISERDGVLNTLELIRGTVCERLDLVDDARDARSERPTIPFVAFVSEPQSYENSLGGHVDAAEIDVTARVITTQTPHHAYAMTGAMCLAAAAQLKETIPNEVSRETTESVTIGHPKGKITVGVEASETAIESVTVGRTVRELVRGSVSYRYVDGLEQLR